MEMCSDVSIFLRTGGLLMVVQTEITNFCLLLNSRTCSGDGMAVWQGWGLLVSDTLFHPADPFVNTSHSSYWHESLCWMLCATHNLHFGSSLLLQTVGSLPGGEKARNRSAEKLKTLFVQVGVLQTASSLTQFPPPGVKFRSGSHLSIIPNHGSIPGDPN